MCGYPPYRELMRVLVHGQVEERVARFAGDLRASMRSFEPALEVLGPCPAPIPFIDRRYRHQILIKATDAARFPDVVQALREVRSPGRDVSFFIDVDPVDTL